MELLLKESECGWTGQGALVIWLVDRVLGTAGNGW